MLGVHEINDCFSNKGFGIVWHTDFGALRGPVVNALYFMPDKWLLGRGSGAGRASLEQGEPVWGHWYLQNVSQHQTWYWRQREALPNIKLDDGL